jgi:hypothetical protein
MDAATAQAEPVSRDGPLWRNLDALLERAPGFDDLLDQRVHLLAARRWRELGRQLPESIVEHERLAALITMMAPRVLERVRAVVEGPLVLIKGPELAARYPDPSLRPFGDLDLLVPDPHAARRALLGAGFVESGDPDLYRDIHHLRPLAWPELPLLVELHRVPKWPDRLTPPRPEELFAAVVPSATGLGGVSALAPEYHAVVVAAHSWAHEPLRRLIDLVDFAAVITEADRDEAAAAARRFGLERVWRTTLAVVDAVLLHGDGSPAPLRLWARNVPDARARTVLESHAESWLAPFWELPPRAAVAAAAAAVARDLRPEHGEGWRAKLHRTRLAIANSQRSRSEHDRILGRRDKSP